MPIVMSPGPPVSRCLKGLNCLEPVSLFINPLIDLHGADTYTTIFHLFLVRHKHKPSKLPQHFFVFSFRTGYLTPHYQNFPEKMREKRLGRLLILMS